MTYPARYSNEDGSGGFNDLSLSTTADTVAITCPLPDAHTVVELDTLFIFCSSLSSATALTVTISRDSAGDEIVIPTFTTGSGDVGAMLTGLTTAADGSVIVKLNALLPRMSGQSLGTLYAHIATDAGTANADEIYISARVQ